MAAGDIVPVPGVQFEETLASASPDVLPASCLSATWHWLGYLGNVTLFVALRNLGSSSGAGSG